MKTESEFDDEYQQQEKNYIKKYSEDEKKDQKQDVSMNFAKYDDQENELYYEEFSINSNEKYETFADFVRIEASCLQCKKIFSFRNKLHRHLKIDCKSIKTTNKSKSKVNESISISIDKEESIIIKFIAFKIDKKYDLVFKK